MDSVKDLLKQEFQVIDMSDLHWLLGIRIEYNKSNIALSQTSYIDKILKWFGLQIANPAIYPLDKNHNLSNKGKEVEHLGYNNFKAGFPTTILDTVNVKQYQQMIGSLMYTVTRMRPDLAFTVTPLSQFLTQPTKYYIRAAKHVLRYLKGTRDLKLLFPLGQTQQYLTFEGFTNSNFAGCLDTHQSTSGYVFKLAGATICWRSHKQ